jgi:serine/threonine protein kinase/tetratricopeptide (TPR) repeat protein
MGQHNGTVSAAEAALARLVEGLTARLQAGEAVDWSAVARAHPEYAEELAAVRPALEMLGQLSRAGDAAVAGAAPPSADDSVPGRLGDFRILGEVGRGGMGVVYEAEQVSLNRRVALKVLPYAATMDPRQLQRFRHEAQAAAMLHHPHIVPVHGVGCERGVHYYAMQLIEGRSLAAVIEGLRGPPAPCHDAPHPPAGPSGPARPGGPPGAWGAEGRPDATQDDADPPPAAPTAPVAALRTQPSRRDKAHYRHIAELVAQAADALEYAHTMGVVHRDIKPANLLLDEGGHLWVTDFGLARLGDGANLTVSGDLLGTLRYMSPEQALAKHGLVDHRTDVYSLGATLYELLTLRPAVDGADKQETLKRIAFEEPVRPRKWDLAIPAELETITLKALAKNPPERYATAGELADDLRRWLEGQTIRARRPSLRQRLDKWVRRHSAAVVAAAAVLLVGAAVSTWQAVRATAAAAAERRANETAQKRLAQLKKANDILRSIFNDLQPSEEGKDGKPLRAQLGERLDRAARELTGEAVGDPYAVADLQTTLGVSLIQLGYPEQAIAAFARAYATFTAELGPDHPDTLDALASLAHVHRQAGKLDRAVSFADEALQRCRATLGPDHPHTLYSMHELGEAYREAGKVDLALPLLEAALPLRRAKLGPDDPATLVSIDALAHACQVAGKLGRAVPLYEEELKLSRAKLGPEHHLTLTSMNNLGEAYQAAGKLDQALPLHEEAFRLLRAKLGPDHPDTLVSMNSLAVAYRTAGKLDQALPLHEEALKLTKAKLGPDHPHTLTGMNVLAAGYWSAGNLDRSVPLFEEVVKLRTATLGPDHPDTLQAQANLGVNYRDAGRLPDAIRLLEDALDRARKRPGPFPAGLLWVPGELAETYDRAGRFDQAGPLYRQGLADTKARFGADHPRTARGFGALGWHLLRAGQPAEAEPVLRECLAIREKKEPDAWATFLTKSLLGGALLGQKKYAEAEPLLRDGYEGMKQREAKVPPIEKNRLAEAAERLAQLYDATGRADEARAWRAKVPAPPANPNP